MSRSPLKLQDIEDAKSRISHSPDSAIKLNTSSKSIILHTNENFMIQVNKSRNLNFSTFKPEPFAINSMEPIENTEYLNGYYWSLNPDLNNENSDNPQNSANNIIVGYSRFN